MKHTLHPERGSALALECLSFSQPWGALLGRGKSIETRSWARRNRDCLLGIHAAKAFPADYAALCCTVPFQEYLERAGYVWDAARSDNPFHLPTGALIAVGHLLAVDAITERTPPPPEPERSFGLYSPGRFAWRFGEVYHLPEPLPIEGSLGLWKWRIPDDLPREVQGKLAEIAARARTPFLTVEQVETILVDPLAYYANGPGGPGWWCHLATSDHMEYGIERLHRIARLMGLKGEWFQDKPRFPHYDVRGSRMRRKALLYGAQEVSHGELATRCRRSPTQCWLPEQGDDSNRATTPSQLTLWGE